MTQYYCYTRSEYRAESTFNWIFFLCLPLLFFPPVSYSAVPLQSIDCFCSSRRLIASLLARFALVRRRNCSCSYSQPVPLQSVDCLCSSTRPFRFSPSIVSALLTINSFSSRQFRSSPSIVSAVLVARSASVRRLFLLF